MIGDDFRYGDLWLSYFGFSPVSPEEDQQFAGRTIEKAEITSLRARPNHYGVKYNDVLVIKFRILKTDWLCWEPGVDGKLTDSEINHIRSWIESPKTPQLLRIDLVDHDMVTEYFGLFTDVQPYLVQGDVYGLDLTFTCDAPYGYSEEHIKEYKFSSTGTHIADTYYTDTAELQETLKPIITITSSSVFGQDETLSIKNVNDNNNVMNLSLPSGLSKLIIDCDKKIVTDGVGNLIPLSDIGATIPEYDQYGFISTDTLLFYWLELLPGDNDLDFTASESHTIKNIEVSSRNIIKSGGF